MIMVEFLIRCMVSQCVRVCFLSLINSYFIFHHFNLEDLSYACIDIKRKLKSNLLPLSFYIKETNVLGMQNNLIKLIQGT